MPRAVDVVEQAMELRGAPCGGTVHIPANSSDQPLRLHPRMQYHCSNTTCAQGEGKMDRITKALLNEFAQSNRLTHLDESEQFEHMVAFLTLRRHYSRALDTADVVTGAGGDTGIDAIGIIVNGVLITDTDQVDELREQNGYIEAAFIFAQAERTEHFQATKITNFGYGVKDFFQENGKLPRNDKISEIAAVIAAIYDRSSYFRRRPICRLYYATTGKFTDDQNLSVRKHSVVSDLSGTKLFDSVEFTLLGADDLQRLFNQTKNAVSRSFVFENKVELPPMEGVDVAFIGYVPAKDFVSIISDDSGDDILGSMFYDNVRDWQDYNPVNSEMRDTLMSNTKERFVLMNNGITIISKELRQTGRNFYLEDFQIVNGCQTSHVLFRQRNDLDETVMIPVRLIATKNDDVIQSIVRATNRQTELKPEQLYALTEFSRSLEAFFSTFPDPMQLFYERRDGQYDRLTVTRSRIVTPQNQIKAFASMFLGEPHGSAKLQITETTNRDKNICREPSSRAVLRLCTVRVQSGTSVSQQENKSQVQVGKIPHAACA